MPILGQKQYTLSIESIQMSQALANDGGVISMNNDGDFDVNFSGETIDAETETDEQTEEPAENRNTFIVDDDVIDAETGEVVNNDDK